jgi:hypothetical protein
VEKISQPGGCFGLGAVVHGEVCCGILVDCFKEEKTSTFFFADFLPQTSPHTHILHTSLRNFAANFAGKTSPAKVRQQI